MLVQKFYQIILLPYLDIIGYIYIYTVIYCIPLVAKAMLLQRHALAMSVPK